MTATPSPGDLHGFQPRFGGDLLSEGERRGLAAAGYVGSEGAAVERRWALLVVDATWGFCGPMDASSLVAATASYPHASGPPAWEALPHIASLVAAARAAEVPIVFTRPARPDERPPVTTSWEAKNRRQRDVPDDAFDLVPQAGARAGDVVLAKQTPSAFFGTPLRRWLTSWDVDGVVICGGTTSGCVRATAVDAFAHDLRVQVAADATFDRLAISHRVSLLDLELKYAGVHDASEIVASWGARRSRDQPRRRGTGAVAPDGARDAEPP